MMALFIGAFLQHALATLITRAVVVERATQGFVFAFLMQAIWFLNVGPAVEARQAQSIVGGLAWCLGAALGVAVAIMAVSHRDRRRLSPGSETHAQVLASPDFIRAMGWESERARSPETQSGIGNP